MSREAGAVGKQRMDSGRYVGNAAGAVGSFGEIYISEVVCLLYSNSYRLSHILSRYENKSKACSHPNTRKNSAV